jgi:peptidoglycan/LPS O-acetylase OafA/YrhL
MLTPSEQKFIRDWEFQKEGPKWKYYLQYIIAWTSVIFLSLFFLIKLIIPDRNMGGWTSFLIVAFVALALAIVITHLVYKTNEKKLQEILRREK